MGSEGDVKKGKAGKGSVKSSLISENGKKGKQLQDLRSVYQIRPGPPTILLPLSSGQAEGADSHSHSLPFLGLSLLNINLFSCPKIWKKNMGHIHIKYKWLQILKYTTGKFEF